MIIDTRLAPSAHPTRRNLLIAAPFAAAALAIPAAAAISTDRTAWNAALATFTKANAASDAFDPHYWRTYEAFKAGLPGMDGIDWGAFPFPDKNHIARIIDLDTAWRNYLAGEGKWWFSPNPEQRKAKYRAALDSVRAFRDAEAKHERDSGFAAADDRYNELTERITDAAATLMAMPAPDLAALRWKLDYLTNGGNEFQIWSMDFAAQAFADIARLLPEGH